MKPPLNPPSPPPPCVNNMKNMLCVKKNKKQSYIFHKYMSCLSGNTTVLYLFDCLWNFNLINLFKLHFFYSHQQVLKSPVEFSRKQTKTHYALGHIVSSFLIKNLRGRRFNILKSCILTFLFTCSLLDSSSLGWRIATFVKAVTPQSVVCQEKLVHLRRAIMEIKKFILETFIIQMEQLHSFNCKTNTPDSNVWGGFLDNSANIWTNFEVCVIINN